MSRTVQPEILDSLEANDPSALGNRRDLRRINRLMGNFRWFAHRLTGRSAESAGNCLEIGAGDGELAKRLDRAGLRGHYIAIERIDPPPDWPERFFWFREDLLASDHYRNADTLLANLILHQFDADRLFDVGRKIVESPIRRIYACEPRRSALHKLQLRCGRLIGFNWVSLHDGAVSIDAGFRDGELPEALGLSPEEWSWRLTETFLGGYRMEAWRQ